MKRRFIIGAAIGLAAAVAQVGFAKLIWQSGFDLGADTAICVKASFVKTIGNATVTLDKGPACQRVQAYEKSNPLWALRRRGETPSWVR